MSGPSSPLKAHTASPAELRERIEAERRGRPFLVYRGEDHEQRILDLDGHGERLSVGRGLTNGLSLPHDTEVSRLHAELECIAGEWTVSDDGLSRNGTYVNGQRISGRHRLRDGDVIRVGRTSIAYKRPAAEDSQPTQIAQELHLSVDAVKSHLRSLFQRFGIEHLPQNQKRSRLVAEALQSGVLATRDL